LAAENRVSVGASFAQAGCGLVEILVVGNRRIDELD
jgi:hypothetical protein